MIDSNASVKRIKQYVRSRKVNGEKQHCFICHRYQSITEIHHLFPVGELVQLLTTYPSIATEILNSIHLAWLCPNHHAIYHLVATSKQKETPRSFAAFQELSLDEQSRFLELLNFHKDEVEILAQVIVQSLEKVQL